MKNKDKYYTPKSTKELIQWLISEKSIYYVDPISDKTVLIKFDLENLLFGLKNFIDTQAIINYDSKGNVIEININLESYRIPYLSKEDFLKEGFKIRGFNEGNTIFCFIKHCKIARSTDVIFNSEKNSILICTLDIKFQKTLFDGIIKNINEFRLLLKQLGIN